MLEAIDPAPLKLVGSLARLLLLLPYVGHEGSGSGVLLEGLGDLRQLENDAAHFESQVFDKIGEEEVALGIEVTREVLKAVYQQSDLVEKLRVSRPRVAQHRGG